MKSFHLNDCLSVFSGMNLVREGAVAVHRLVGYIMETDACSAVTPTIVEVARKCIAEQLPFLRDIDVEEVKPLYRVDASPRSNPYLSVWLDMQALRYGREHAIIPLRLWREQRAMVA